MRVLWWLGAWLVVDLLPHPVQPSRLVADLGGARSRPPGSRARLRAESTPSAATRWRRSDNLRDVSSHLGDHRLPRHLEPAGYSLALVPHLEDGHFAGEVTINVTCRHGTTSVVLHAHEDLNVTRVAVSVNPQASTVVAREIDVRHTERDLENQWLIIILSERLERDNSYSVHLKFNGNLDSEQTEGLYRRKFIERTTNRTQWYADTNMKLDSARRIFPCFDEPEYKAVFDVRVGTPDRQHVFSNMPLAEITDMTERYGWYWKRFVKSPPMSTMSFGLFMFEFEHYSLSKGVLQVVGRAALRNRLEEALDNLDQVFEYFLEYMGVDDPLPKLDLVVVPDGPRKEVAGSFGLITINENSLDQIEALAYLTIGQWIGHLMTPQWWGELDISSGIIYSLGHSFLEKLGYVNAWASYSNYYEYAKLEPFKGIWSARDDANVIRGSWFIRMVQYILTEDTFEAALRKFIQIRQYDVFSEHDLWTVLSQHGWDERTLARDVSVEDVAKSWLTKERFPVVTVTRNYGRNTATVEQHVFLKKKFYRIQDKDQLRWYVPIMYLSPDNLQVSDARAVAWMKNQKEITVDRLPEPDRFIIVNPAEIGMFMVNYDPTNWALLADALQRKVLPTPVRAKLLHDAWNLAYSGELNFNTAMNMTLFLKDEAEYEVWDVMVTMHDHVGRFLGGTSAGDKFKRYFVHLATRAMENMGDMRWSRSDDRNVYNMLKYSVKQESSRKPTQRQRGLFDAWARGNGELSAKTVEAICLVLKHGAMEEYERGLHRVIQVLKQSAEGSRMFGLVRLITVCGNQPEKIERLLGAAFLAQDAGFSDEARHVVVIQLTGYYNGYSTMFSFLRQNWEALRQGLEDKPDLWVALVEEAMTLFKTEEGVKAAARMFAEKRAELGNAAPAVQAGLEAATANAQWSSANVPVLEQWLDQHLPADDGKQQ